MLATDPSRLRDAEAALRARPSDPAALTAVGAALCALGRCPEGEPHFRRALKLQPGFIPAIKNLVIAEYTAGRPEAAMPLLEKLAPQQATREFAALFRGMIAADQRRFADAIAHFRGAGRLVESDVQAMLRHSRAAAQTGGVETAVETLRKAITLYPAEQASYLELAELCMQHGNRKCAIDILAYGIPRVPDPCRLLVQQGVVLETAGDRPAAKASFRKAISLNKDNAVAVSALAVVQLLEGERADALRTLDGAASAFPRNYYVRYLRGYAWAQEGDSRAAEELRTSIGLNDQFAPAHQQLAKLLLRSDPEEAMRRLETALRLNPNAQAAKYQLARLYLQAGKSEEGNRLMAEVQQANIESDPKPSVAEAAK